VTVASFLAPLSGFSDSALVVMASGFLTPAANQNGPAFGLLAVTASGATVLLPAVSSVRNVTQRGNLMVFPNPGSGKFQFIMPSGKTLKEIRVISMLGKSETISSEISGKIVSVNAAFSAGMYRLEAIAADDTVHSATFLVE
jgi:hypothetical protein